MRLALPDELVSGFGWSESAVADGVREALVMELVRLVRLTEARAAEILDPDRWGLLDLMGRYRCRRCGSARRS